MKPAGKVKLVRLKGSSDATKRSDRLAGWRASVPLVSPEGGLRVEWQATLRDKRKYYGKRAVEAYLHRPTFELYDLENDPHEVNNLADDPQYAKVLEELKAKLKAFQKRTKDPWIVKWKYE